MQNTATTQPENRERQNSALPPPPPTSPHPYQLPTISRLPGESRDEPLTALYREAVMTDPLASGLANPVTQGPPTFLAPPPMNPTNVPSVYAQAIAPTNYTSSVPTEAESLDVMTASFLSRCRTLPLDPREVSEKEAGLLVFARASAWAHVVDLSENLLKGVDSDGSDFTLTLRLRLQGLYKLKMFDVLSNEASKILTSEEKIYYTKMKDLGRSDNINSSSSSSIVGSKGVGTSAGADDASVGGTSSSEDIIFSMRLLLADIKAMTGQGEEALQQLYALKDHLTQTSSSIASSSRTPTNHQWWLWRTRNAIVSAAIRQRQWRAAIGEITSMCEDTRRQACSNKPTVARSLLRAEIVLQCRLARILLQIGAMKASISACDVAASLLNALGGTGGGGGLSEVDTVNDKMDQQQHEDMTNYFELTRGLVLFGRDKYEEAMNVFSALIDKEQMKQVTATMEPSIALLPPSTPSQNGYYHPLASVVEMEDTLLPAVINNYAICALYLRKVAAAISKLEGLILDDPVRYMVDPVVFNLCTLYDLSFAPAMSTLKKKVLQNVALAYHVGDPVLHWRSFRLT